MLFVGLPQFNNCPFVDASKDSFAWGTMVHETESCIRHYLYIC